MAAEPTPRTTTEKGRFQAGAARSEVRVEEVDEREMKMLHIQDLFLHNPCDIKV